MDALLEEVFPNSEYYRELARKLIQMIVEGKRLSPSEIMGWGSPWKYVYMKLRRAGIIAYRRDPATGKRVVYLTVNV